MEKKFDLKKWLINNVLIVVMVGIILAITIISKGKFLQINVLLQILNQSAVKLLVALGVMFVILSGQADLSGGKMVALAACFAGSLAQSSDYSIKFWPSLPEIPAFFAILAAVILCCLIGAFSGVVVSKLKVPAFLATLGTQMILNGGTNLYMAKAPNNSQPLAGLLPDFRNVGVGNIGGVTFLVMIAIAAAVFVHVLQTKTTLGKEIFAVGGNPEAAKVSGINVFKITIITYALAGAFYGLAGALECARTGSANANFGAGYELDAIASCVIGGCSAGGGIGGVPGVFLGVIIFTVISYGLTFIGLSSYWQNVVRGIIVIIAIALDVRKYSKKD